MVTKWKFFFLAASSVHCKLDFRRNFSHSVRRVVFQGDCCCCWVCLFSPTVDGKERFMAFGTEQINALEIIIIIHGF